MFQGRGKSELYFKARRKYTGQDCSSPLAEIVWQRQTVLQSINCASLYVFIKAFHNEWLFGTSFFQRYLWIIAIKTFVGT